MKRLNSERGMSLVEATIILLILATLTAVVAPSMGDYLEDARQMKAKEDVEALGMGVQRLLRDTGLKGLKLVAGNAFTLANRVEVLTTAEGTAPALSAAAVDFAAAGNVASAGEVNWILAGIIEDTFEDQLVNNAAAYTLPAASNRARGWRGAYVNPNMGTDPWGYKYYANVVFLTTASNGTVGTAEGDVSGYWNRDVVVLSSGANNTIDTPIGGSANGGSGSASLTDDIIFTLQGNTR